MFYLEKNTILTVQGNWRSSFHFQFVPDIKYVFISSKAGGVRNRTIITKHQLQVLKSEFEYNKFPTQDRKRELSILVGLDYKVVTNWFQNKRKIEYRIDKLRGLRALTSNDLENSLS